MCVRPQRGAAAAEYESFRTAAHLDASQLASLEITQFQPEPTTRAFTERMRDACSRHPSPNASG
ncbi:MAG: hypothetical protein WAZ28_07180 [Microbacterium sp.]